MVVACLVFQMCRSRMTEMPMIRDDSCSDRDKNTLVGSCCYPSCHSLKRLPCSRRMLRHAGTI